MADFISDVMGFDPADLTVFNEPAENSYDDQIYRTRPKDSKAEDGHYRSRIKIIYNPFDFKRSIVKQATYAMTDEDGFFMVKSKLADGDRDCPLFKSWKKLWFSGDDKKKAWAKEMYDKTESQWCLVQILEDDNQPELVGKLKVMKLPKAVFVKMTAKMKPSPESKKAPYPVMDYLIGLELAVDVTPGPKDPTNPSRETREISYDLCEFEDYAPVVKVDGTPLFTEEELETIDTYKTTFDAIAKAKTKAKADEAKAKLTSLQDGMKVLYSKALDYLKENSVNLVDECAYKEWTAEETARVNRWIDIVSHMLDPKSTVYESIKSTKTETITDAAAHAEGTLVNKVDPADPVSVMMPGAGDDDLPF